jgi:hypothetical protein
LADDDRGIEMRVQEQEDYAQRHHGQDTDDACSLLLAFELPFVADEIAIRHRHLLR